MITLDDKNYVYDEEGNRRHKSENYRLQIGNVHIGYYVTQEWADEAREVYIEKFLSELEKLTNEAKPHEEKLKDIYSRLTRAKRVVSELRAELKAAEKAARIPLSNYEKKLEIAREMFPERFTNPAT